MGPNVPVIQAGLVIASPRPRPAIFLNGEQINEETDQSPSLFKFVISNGPH